MHTRPRMYVGWVVVVVVMVLITIEMFYGPEVATVELAAPVPWEPFALAAVIVLLFAGVRLAHARAKEVVG